MRVYGVDFTSAPGPGKAIAVAARYDVRVELNPF